MGSMWSSCNQDTKKRRLPIYVFRRDKCGVNREWVLVLEFEYDPYFHITFYEIPDSERDGITAEIWNVYQHPTVCEADEQVLRSLCFRFANNCFHRATSSGGDTTTKPPEEHWLNDKTQTHLLTTNHHWVDNDTTQRKKKGNGTKHPPFVRPM